MSKLEDCTCKVGLEERNCWEACDQEANRGANKFFVPNHATNCRNNTCTPKRDKLIAECRKKYTGDERISNEKDLKLGDNGKLYIQDVLYKFYPELNNNKDIINKIKDDTYSVKQFGMKVASPYYGDWVTWTGNTDKSCFKNISGNSYYDESYGIIDNGNAECCNQVLDNVKRENTTLREYDHTHLQIVKAAKNDSNIDNHKPVVTVSQIQPLVIANVSDGKLIKKDGTVAKITFDACTQLFLDVHGNATNCTTGKGEGCNDCKEAMWDYQGPSMPVYVHDYSPEMV